MNISSIIILNIKLNIYRIENKLLWNLYRNYTSILLTSQYVFLMYDLLTIKYTLYDSIDNTKHLGGLVTRVRILFI